MEDRDEMGTTALHYLARAYIKRLPSDISLQMLEEQIVFVRQTLEAQARVGKVYGYSDAYVIGVYAGAELGKVYDFAVSFHRIVGHPVRFEHNGVTTLLMKVFEPLTTR